MKTTDKRDALLYTPKALWDLHPELRFNQLVAYVNEGEDAFYMEDKKFLDRIQNKLDSELPVETIFNFDILISES